MIDKQRSSILWSTWIGVALNVLVVLAAYWSISQATADHSQTIVERIKAVEIDVQWLKKFCAGDKDDHAAMRGRLLQATPTATTSPAGPSES